MKQEANEKPIKYSTLVSILLILFIFIFGLAFTSWYLNSRMPAEMPGEAERIKHEKNVKDNVRPGSGTAKDLSDRKTARRDRYFNRGLELFHEKNFIRAAYLFHQAEALDLNDPEIKYYLMECYANMEKKPYDAESKTIRLAVEVKALDPEGSYAKEASDILDEFEKTRKDSGSVSKEAAEEKKSIKKEEGKKTAALSEKSPVPSLPGGPNYPVAEPGKAFVQSKPNEEAGQANRPGQKTPPVTITLNGRVTRPNESGQLINPSGVTLRLVNITGPEEYEGVTDTKGNYQFDGVIPANDYVLAAISNYKYTNYVTEYYNYPYYYGPYNPPYSYPYPYNPYMPYSYSTGSSNATYSGSVDTRVTLEERNAGRIGLGPFDSGAVKVYAGDSVIYYPPNYNYPGYYAQEYTRPITEEYNLSWHLRMNLEKPGEYKMDLTPDNADNKFISDLSPNYNPITHEPYDEVTDVKPIPVM